HDRRAGQPLPATGRGLPVGHRRRCPDAPGQSHLAEPRHRRRRDRTGTTDERGRRQQRRRPAPRRPAPRRPVDRRPTGDRPPGHWGWSPPPARPVTLIQGAVARGAAWQNRMVTTPAEPPSFYDQIGGEPTFRKLIDEFYAGVARDPVLRPL